VQGRFGSLLPKRAASSMIRPASMGGMAEMPADPPTPTDARGMLLARFGEIRVQLEKDA
jgi:hypothetical protein